MSDGFKGCLWCSSPLCAFSALGTRVTACPRCDAPDPRDRKDTPPPDAPPSGLVVNLTRRWPVSL